MTRYQREKKSIQRYAKTLKGIAAHSKAKTKYNHSLRGSVQRRFWRKGLSSSEETKALKAFEFFDGKCQCCGSRKHNGRRWHLDHKDGKFRGILCHLCNCAAAFVRDSIAISKLLTLYLKRTE